MGSLGGVNDYPTVPMVLKIFVLPGQAPFSQIFSAMFQHIK